MSADKLDIALDAAADVGVRSALAKLFLHEYERNPQRGWQRAIQRVLDRAAGQPMPNELAEAWVRDKVALAEAREELAARKATD